MALPVYDIELVKTTQLTNNTIALFFSIENDQFTFSAGQFVSLRFEYENEQHKRSYSIACSPETFKETGVIEIALGLVPGGRASECFSNVTAGQKFSIAGPAGVLTMPDELPKNLVLVGTGTGMAPYRAMIPELKQALKKGMSLRIIMGARYRNDVFYDDDFKALVKDFSEAHYDVCYSRETEVDNQLGEYKGYVQHHFESLCLEPGKDFVYLCGNPPMIDDSLSLLKSAGFNNRQIRREKYTFSR